MPHQRCLTCYGDAPDGKGYHEACLKSLFPNGEVPVLDFGTAELEALALELVQSQATITGVQRKLSLGWVGERGSPSLTIVGLDGPFILKPPHPDYPGICLLEDATMHMAGAFGLETVPHTLIPLASGELAYLAVRIDRTSSGERMRMEDACQLSGRLTEHKYRGSLLKAGRALLSWSSFPQDDAIRFWELAIFCFLTGNADMHLKNFSLLTAQDGMTRLAPAYDLVPTALLMPEDNEESALTIHGKKARLRREDFSVLGSALLLTPKQMDNAWERMQEGLGQARSVLERSFIPNDQKAAYQELLASRSDRLGMRH